MGKRIGFDVCREGLHTGFTRCIPLLVSITCMSQVCVKALDNGVGLTPFMGWTSWLPDYWEGNNFNVTASGVLEVADLLISTGLKDMGYNYVLIDDGWPQCAPGFKDPSGKCSNSMPRLEDASVLVDPDKFPSSSPGMNDGIKLVADKLHSKGLKIGIYTAPHGLTCGGNVCWEKEVNWCHV